jgi:hypothetical protein
MSTCSASTLAILTRNNAWARTVLYHRDLRWAVSDSRTQPGPPY